MMTMTMATDEDVVSDEGLTTAMTVDGQNFAK
jgi:hypothetical protein